MSGIFVSYAKEDRDRVEPLVRALAEEGWDVFWDRSIPTGRTWRDVIGTKLEAARCVVVVWSEHAITSDWVCEEADFGKQHQILASVLIDDVIPLIGFRSVQSADLSGWDGDSADSAFAQLIADIESISGLEVSAANADPGPVDGPVRDARPLVSLDAWNVWVKEHSVSLPSIDEIMNPDKGKRAMARSEAVRTILDHATLSTEERKEYLLVLVQMFKDQDTIEEAQELADAQLFKNIRPKKGAD